MLAATRDETVKNKATLRRVSDTQLEITRVFRAPPRLVYDAWTKPELVSRWWAPASRGVTLVECRADVRVGGTYRYVLQRTPEEQYAFSGTYRELSPPGRLVYTQCFEPFPDPGVLTITFAELSGGFTLMTSQETYPSKDALDMAIGNGMEDGMAETLDQLDALVSSLRG